MATVQFVVTCTLTDAGTRKSMTDLADLLHDAMCAQIELVPDENGEDVIESFDGIDPGEVLS